MDWRRVVQEGEDTAGVHAEFLDLCNQLIDQPLFDVSLHLSERIQRITLLHRWLRDLEINACEELRQVAGTPQRHAPNDSPSNSNNQIQADVPHDNTTPRVDASIVGGVSSLTEETEQVEREETKAKSVEKVSAKENTTPRVDASIDGGVSSLTEGTEQVEREETKAKSVEKVPAKESTQASITNEEKNETNDGDEHDEGKGCMPEAGEVSEQTSTSGDAVEKRKELKTPSTDLGSSPEEGGDISSEDGNDKIEQEIPPKVSGEERKRAAEDMKKVASEWGVATAGGCMNHATWRKNPQFILEVDNAETVEVVLRQFPEPGKPREGIGLYALPGDNSRRKAMVDVKPLAKSSFTKAKTVSVQFECTPKSNCVIVPCTFYPDLHCSFEVEVIKGDTAHLYHAMPWEETVVDSSFTDKTAGGCRNYATFIDNPQFLVTAQEPTDIRVLVTPKGSKECDSHLGIYVVEAHGESSSKLFKISSKDIRSKAVFASKQAGSVSSFVEKQLILIPCTFEPGHEFGFELSILSEKVVQVKELQLDEDVSEHGAWTESNAGGSFKHVTWRKNPQYAVTVKKGASEVVLKLQQEAKEADRVPIGLYAFQSPSGKQKLVVRPEHILASTTFSNDSDIICKVPLQDVEWTGDAFTFAVMPSTYEPDCLASFTLSAFTSDGFEPPSLTLIESGWQHHSVNAEWDSSTSGGCFNHASWRSNPQFQFVPSEDCKIICVLSVADGVSHSGIGLYVTEAPVVAAKTLNISDEDCVLKKAPFRKSKETYCTFQAKAGQALNIIPSTYRPDDQHPFSLTLFTTDPSALVTPLQTPVIVTRAGEWKGMTAGGCINHASWWLNPKYELQATKDMIVTMVLRQKWSKKLDNLANLLPIGLYLTKSDGNGNPVVEQASDMVGRAPFECSEDVSLQILLQAGERPVVVTPCTFEANQEMQFEMDLYLQPGHVEDDVSFTYLDPEEVAAKEVAIEAAREAEERLEEQLRQVDCGEVSVSETCGGKSDESIPSNEESQEPVSPVAVVTTRGRGLSCGWQRQNRPANKSPTETETSVSEPALKSDSQLSKTTADSTHEPPPPPPPSAESVAKPSTRSPASTERFEVKANLFSQAKTSLRKVDVAQAQRERQDRISRAPSIFTCFDMEKIRKRRVALEMSDDECENAIDDEEWW